MTVGWSPDIDIGIMDNDTAWQDPPLQVAGILH
jgi:hypothetical protein